MFKKYFGIELIFNNDEKVEFFNLFDNNFGKNNDNLVIMAPEFKNCLPFDNIYFLDYLSFLKK